MSVDLSFLLQWNITSSCEYSCNYCYLKNKYLPNRHLDADLILEEIIRFSVEYKRFFVNITGGNPLLHPDFRHILKELASHNIIIRVLGNPLVAPKQIETIKSVSDIIEYYQLSVDGTNGHIANRNIDNTENIWESVRQLKSFDIPVCIMLTLTKYNLHEVIPTLEKAIQMGVSLFSFSRVVECEGYHSNINWLTSNEYKGVLEEVFEYLVLNDVSIFSFKDSLWKLFLYKKGLYKPNEDVISGCGAGIATLSIMPNGDIQPCSRLPIKLGNIREVSLKQVWQNHPVIKELRNFNKYQKCNSCALVRDCRGCRAIAYSYSNEITGADPFCWQLN